MILKNVKSFRPHKNRAPQLADPCRGPSVCLLCNTKPPGLLGGSFMLEAWFISRLLVLDRVYSEDPCCTRAKACLGNSHRRTPIFSGNTGSPSFQRWAAPLSLPLKCAASEMRTRPPAALPHPVHLLLCPLLALPCVCVLFFCLHSPA